MFSIPGRNGRRRRVLNEEVLSASSSHVALRAIADREPPSDAPRYSEAAGVENHPQVTDFVPRRYRTIALTVVVGVVLTTGFAALHYFAIPIASACGLKHTGALDLASPGCLASWISAVVLFTTSVACVLVYSIRRHRIDDFRGRYRVWLAAAVACLVLSANRVAGLHDVFAQAMGHHTGWAVLRDSAFWWLGVAGLPLVWIAVRMLMDVRECRLAAVLLLASIASFFAALVSLLGVIPAATPPISTLVTGAAALLADWLLFCSVATYARFVVLDAQGLIPVVGRPLKSAEPRNIQPRPTAAPSLTPSKLATSIFAAAGRPQPKSKLTDLPPQPVPATTQWTDGRRAERDEFDDADADEADDRKLNKSERKRLRKLKARNRAA